MSSLFDIDLNEPVNTDSKFKTMVKNGKNFENTLESFLKEQYSFPRMKTQAVAGKKPGYNGNYVADIIVNNILISAKFQNVDGTVERKFPEEMIALQHLCIKYGYKKAYIVYHGKGFNRKLIESYKSEEYEEICYCPDVQLVDFGDFKKLDILND